MTSSQTAGRHMARELVDVVLRHNGQDVERARTNLDVERGEELLEHMVAALRRANISERDIDQCVLDVYRPGFRDPEFSFTALDTRAN